MRVSLILLARDEREGSRALRPLIPFEVADEVVVIDGQSTDGTREFWEREGVRVITQPVLGLGNGYLHGLRHTTGDILAFLSLDGNGNPREIPRLIDVLERGADLVVGTRFAPGGGSEAQTVLRVLGNRLFARLVSFIFRHRVTDACFGLRAIRRSAMESLALDEPTFGLEFQMGIRAVKRGLRLVELPMIEGKRIGRRSGVYIFRVGLTFCKVLLKEWWIGQRFGPTEAGSPPMEGERLKREPPRVGPPPGG